MRYFLLIAISAIMAFLLVASLARNFALGLQIASLVAIAVSVSFFPRRSRSRPSTYFVVWLLVLSAGCVFITCWLLPYYRKQSIVAALLQSGAAVRLEVDRDRRLPFLQNKVPKSIATYIGEYSLLKPTALQVEIDSLLAVDFAHFPPESLRYLQLMLTNERASGSAIPVGLIGWLNSLPDSCDLNLLIKSCSEECLERLSAIQHIKELYLFLDDIEAVPILKGWEVSSLRITGAVLSLEQADAISSIGSVNRMEVAFDRFEESALDRIMQIESGETWIDGVLLERGDD